MRIRPTSGMDVHRYGQLVKLGRSLVSLQSRPLTSESLTVCHWGLGDSRKGPVYFEFSHRAVHARPPWCSIPNDWDARYPEAIIAAAGS